MGILVQHTKNGIQSSKHKRTQTEKRWIIQWKSKNKNAKDIKWWSW